MLPAFLSFNNDKVQTMRIYLAYQNEDENFDTVDAAIVIAPDEKTAKDMYIKYVSLSDEVLSVFVIKDIGEANPDINQSKLTLILNGD